MDNKKEIKSESSFSWEERKAIIKEYETGPLTRAEVWKKYTGQPSERGRMLRWMRKLGYIPDKKNERKKSSFDEPSRVYLPLDTTKEPDKNPEALQRKVHELEKQLELAQLKAEGYELMIEIAEKELNIPIRKKHDTK